MKLLNLDIEMSPAKVYVWDLRVNGYITPEKIIEPKRMLCFAAKWVGEDEVFFRSQWGDSREAMVQKMWDLLDEADAVLHFNGTTFDIPNVNTEFILEGYNPPSPYSQVDLYKTIKRRFRFLSSSLKEVSKALETTRKIENEGFSLWTRVMAGDKEAQDLMRDYNIGDILANEDLYDKLLPWIPGHPNVNLYSDVTIAPGCDKCGSTRLVPRSSSYTAMSKFDQFQCLKCGSWMRKVTRAAGSDLRSVTW